MKYFKIVTTQVLGGLIWTLQIPIRYFLKNSLTVFNFHEVSNHPSEFQHEFGLSVTENNFKKQIAWIEHNYNIIHPTELLGNNVLPNNAALICFDDGFYGAMTYGLDYLKLRNITPVVFLNMANVLSHKPMISSIVCFLQRYSKTFMEYAIKQNLSNPLHLSFTPILLEKYLGTNNELDYSEILQYQGRFSDLSIIVRADKLDKAMFGNHLYEHWNAMSLSEEEFVQQYKTNEMELRKLKNYVNLFAFPNGQPNTCFNRRDIGYLKYLGARKIFSTSGGINRELEKYILGRLCFNDSDTGEGRYWYKVGRAAISTSNIGF